MRPLFLMIVTVGLIVGGCVQKQESVPVQDQKVAEPVKNLNGSRLVP